MIHAPSRTTRLLQLGAIVAVVIVLGCRDDLLSPRTPEIPRARPGPEGANLTRTGDAQTLTFSITGDPITGGGGTSVPTASRYTHDAWGTVTASGFIILTPTYSWTSPVHQYGPSGASSIDLGGVNWNITRLGSLDETETDTVHIFAGGPRSMGIASYGPYSITLDQYQWPPHDKIECGPQSGHPEIPCFQASGSRSFTIAPFSADISVRPESAVVSPGSTPYVDFRAVPLYLRIPHAAGDSVITPFVYDSSSWVPDGEAAGGEATESAVYAAGNGACQFNWGPGCRRKIIGSGTFSFAAFVNGVWKKGSTHISAAFLKLDVNPKGVRLGDSATFTPSWSDGGTLSASNISGWTWTPDVAPGHATLCAATLPCRAKIQESGTMRVSVTRNGVTRTAKAHVIVYSNFRLDADKPSVFTNDTVTFTAKYDGTPGPAARWRWAPDDSGSSAVNCAAGASQCAASMPKSGTLWAYSATGTPSDSAGAHVTVTRRRIQLSGPGSVIAGDTGVFTASATSGANWAVTGWLWRAGGSNASRTPGTSGRLGNGAARRTASPRGSARFALGNTSVPPPCSDTVCRDEIDASGTMWVFGTIDGFPDSASVPVVAVPEITVACTPSAPVRGESVSCAATSKTGTVVTTLWTFRPDDSSLSPITSVSSSAVWSGLAVISGTVVVQGTVGGVSASPDSALITPTARTNFTIPIDTGRATAGQEGLDCYTLPMDSATVLGWNRVPGHCVIDFDVPPFEPNPERTDITGGTIRRITSGPNEGLWYVNSLQTKVYLRSQLLRDIRSDAATYRVDPSDLFVGNGCRGAGLLSDASVYLTPLVVDSTCMQRRGGIDMVGYVWRHEGCHSARAVYSLQNDLPNVTKLQAIEKLAMADSGWTRSEMTRNLIDIRDSIFKFGGAIDLKPRADSQPPAQFDVWTPANSTGGWVFQNWPVWGYITPSSVCQ